MRRCTIAGAFISLCLCGLLFSQDTSALINEALDKQVKLDLNATLPQTISAIGDQTGVRIEARQSVWDLLPWGQETNITAKFENQTLRQALDAITHKLGLEYAVKDQAIELQPMAALRRLGRRSTPQELAAIDILSSTALGASTDRMTMEKVAAAVDQKLVEIKSPFAIENRAPDSTLTQPVFVPRNATLADALEAIAADTSATWYPWGKSVLIVGKEDAIRKQLSATVNLRYNGSDVSQVLLELSQRAGVHFDIQPGAIQRIPA